MRTLVSALSLSSLVAQCLAQGSQVPLGHHEIHKLKWEDCGDANNHTLQCSTLEVPMDHFGPPSDKRFTIPLVRLLAANASASGDRHIFFNPGGPGGSGVGFLRGRAAQFNKIIGEDFHLLGFDPRAVGKSTPSASCFTNSEQRGESFQTNPWDVEFEAGEMYTRAENKARACQDIMGEHGKFINTPQTAADMNSILDALGQEDMYYWGFSYGTTLGQTYAQMYPERVSRLIIDGVSNLDKWYKAEVDEEEFTDTDAIFEGFLKECLNERTDCPLSSIQGTDFESPSELKKYVDNYLSQLSEEPIPVYLNASIYGSITRQKIVTNGIFFALYSPITWPTLARNLAELLNGNSTPAFLAYSPSKIAQILTDDSNTFVVNNDMKDTGKDFSVHGIQEIRNYTLSLPGKSDLMSEYQASDIFDRASWLIETTHDFQPRYSHEYPPVKTKNPLLVLSTTYDPVCPLVSAKKAWKSFKGAGFVEQKSYGHCTVSMPSLCTAKHVRRYFNEGKVPDKYSTCDIDQKYFGEDSLSGLDMDEENQELLESLRTLAESESIFPLKF